MAWIIDGIVLGCMGLSQRGASGGIVREDSKEGGANDFGFQHREGVFFIPGLGYMTVVGD